MFEHISAYDEIKALILIRQGFAGVDHRSCIERWILEDNGVWIATVDMCAATFEILQRDAIDAGIVDEEFAATSSEVEDDVFRTQQRCYLGKEGNFLIIVRETGDIGLRVDSPLQSMPWPFL
jgi:hypothetical protein